MQTYSLVIVGAGLCGLTLAESLRPLVPNTLVLEKSRGVGGRMATRRDEYCTYDHGAQFYKHSIGRPFLWHDRWLRANVCTEWFRDEETFTFCGQNGMTALAKDLASTNQVMLSERVEKIVKVEGRMNVLCESGKVISAERVVMTCPLPQCLAILKNSFIPYPEDLKNITYVKSLVGLFEIDDPKGVMNDFTYKNFSPPLFSISNNRSKNLGPGVGVSVVMSATFSHDNFEKKDDEVLAEIEYTFLSQMMPTIKIKKRFLKKWRYSHALETHAEDYLPLVANENIILAGDAFGGGSLTGAVRSAQALEIHLKRVMGFTKPNV